MSLPIYQRVAVTDTGDVIPGAEYTVINENTGVAQPIYSDRTGATLLTPPYFADSAGTIQFFIAQGTTFRVAASGGVGTYTDRYIYAAHPQSSPTDTTAGALMEVGAFGLGGLGLVVTDANTALRPGFYCGPGASGVNYFNEASGQYGTLLVEVRQVLQIMQTNTFGNRSAKRESLDQGVTWTAWQEIYTTANAIGTVNYNSGLGVSDGALFEQYSSGDVRVTKFTDGTMIQRQISGIAVAIVLTPSSGGFYFNDFAIGYPEAFVGEPSLSNTSSSTGTVTIPNVTGAPTQTVANLRFVTVSSATINHRIGFTAIGRWF